MTQVTNRAIAALAVVVALTAGIASAIGIVARNGALERVTSVRGETYDMVTSGAYAYNAQRVVAEGVGWDVFTLLVAVPALLLAAALTARGSFRGRLAVAGLFGYTLYQYLEYAVTWAFGPLFLLFVVIYAASLAGIALVAVNVGREGIHDRFGAGFPRRAWPALLVAMSLLLTALWLSRIFQALTVGVDGLLFGETTMTVQALDLGLVVPISVAVAVLAWRGSEIGYAVSAAYVITFITMAAALTSMLVSASIVAGEIELAPIAIFALAAAAAGWLTLRIYSAVHAAPARSSSPSLSPSPA